MKTMQTLLYVFAVLFVLSGIFTVLPWPWINGFMQWSGGISYPDDAIVVYTLRGFILFTFWVGVLIFFIARDPVANSQAALALGGLFLTCAVLCLVLGIRYELPGFFYFDAISSALLGGLLLAYRRGATAKA